MRSAWLAAALALALDGGPRTPAEETPGRSDRPASSKPASSKPASSKAGSSEPASSKVGSSEPASSKAGPSKPAAAPRIDLDLLQAGAPGWLVAGSDGAGESGSITLERVVWPFFYLHWRPLEDAAPGRVVTPQEAEGIVAGLWEGLELQTPLEPAHEVLPQHPSVSFLTLADHGQMRMRYWVWACPQSRRLLVAEAALNLKVNAPAELLAWMGAMVRTVRCHATAPLEEAAHLSARYDVSDSDLSYSRPASWISPGGYRVQSAFGGSDVSAARPARTVERGQELALALDADQGLHLTWSREEDFPMSYDVMRQRTEEHWRPRAVDVMILGFSTSADVWVADGMARLNPSPGRVPPTFLNKFRAWMWRRDGTVYFAVGRLAGFNFGRNLLKAPPEVWESAFQRMFQSLPD